MMLLRRLRPQFSDGVIDLAPIYPEEPDSDMGFG